jgi:hypothetical protein
MAFAGLLAVFAFVALVSLASPASVVRADPSLTAVAVTDHIADAKGCAADADAATSLATAHASVTATQAECDNLSVPAGTNIALDDTDGMARPTRWQTTSSASATSASVLRSPRLLPNSWAAALR